jgi:hypothetical protein
MWNAHQNYFDIKKYKIKIYQILTNLLIESFKKFPILRLLKKIGR